MTGVKGLCETVKGVKAGVCRNNLDWRVKRQLKEALKHPDPTAVLLKLNLTPYSRPYHHDPDPFCKQQNGLNYSGAPKTIMEYAKSEKLACIAALEAFQF